MKAETVRQYAVLYQYLLFLKEPTYIFLIQALQHLSPSRWWEEYIAPVLQHEKKENFKYLDFSDLLNVLKMNWDAIFRYLDKDYKRFKYDDEYRLVNRVHYIRTIVAHANESEMSAFVFADSLSQLLDYSRLINAPVGISRKLETDLLKYKRNLPEKKIAVTDDKALRGKIIETIENEVLLKAKSCERLPADIRLSVDRTAMRINSMRTVDEIVGFFNNAIRSERGIVVQDALHKEGLSGFDDIKDKINMIYGQEIA